MIAIILTGALELQIQSLFLVNTLSCTHAYMPQLVYAAIDTNEAGGGGAGDAGSGGSGRLVQLPPPTEYSTVVY